MAQNSDFLKISFSYVVSAFFMQLDEFYRTITKKEKSHADIQKKVKILKFKYLGPCRPRATHIFFIC